MFIRLMWSVAIPITALVAIDWFLAMHFQADAPHSVSVIGSGMIAFVFAFTWMRDKDTGASSAEASLRSAIAAAIVVQYLTLVSIVAFFGGSPDNAQLPAITQTLISSFTTIVGVVIAFYFGSSAYVQASKARGERGSAADAQQGAPTDRPAAASRQRDGG